MGLFNRKSKQESLEMTVQPTVIDEPLVSVDDLEQMVYATYQEKLELEQKLAQEKERTKFLEEQQTKLRAAEQFSRQSESERKAAERQSERLELRIETLEKQLKQEQARSTTLELKAEELRRVNDGQMAVYRNELISEISSRFEVSIKGRLTKQLVLEFLDACREQCDTTPESEASPQDWYKRGGVFTVEGDA